MAALKDEDIIRRRLLTQTAVGYKGVPPLTRLTKKYLQLCDKVLTGGEGEEVEELQGQLLRDIANIEFLGQKQEAICAAHRSEQATFVEKRGALEAEVEAARAAIEQRKADLVAARELRQHNEEYERLRAMAVRFPRCADMEAAIREEEAALAETQVAVERAERTAELRRKQFALLLHTIGSLTDEVEEPPPAAAAAGAQPTAMETDS